MVGRVPQQWPQTLFVWHRGKARRPFSFRRRPSGFRVIVDELLLRKTRAGDADRVFPLVIERYPDAQRLAEADYAELRELVAPLGLPARASHLIEAARALISQHGGKVPASREALEALPGVGHYTARAVLSLGLNRAEAMVDGPIARFVGRFRGIVPASGRAPGADPAIWRQAHMLMPASQSHRYHRALLDVVAAFCKPQNPRCTACPLSSMCKYPVEGRRADG